MAVRTGFRQEIRKNRVLLFMLLPAVLYYFIFSYIPMAGVVLAFNRFTIPRGIFGSPWVGLDNFKFFFSSGQALLVTKNTILYNLAFIFMNNVLQITLAILLSEIACRWYKKLAQSVMFLPYFISWVVVGAFAYNLFNYEHGTLNTLLGYLGMKPVDIYGTPSAWKYIIIAFQSWKWVGYGTVVYLAAVTNIDIELFEAANIDGAGIWKKIRYITLPSLKPMIVILVLLSVGNIMRGDFGLFYQLVGNNGTLYNATDVIDTFVFRSLTQSYEFGIPAACGLYQSVLCFVIILLTNSVVKRVQPDYSLF